VSAGKPTHASVMAALYWRGCIAMLQGDAAGETKDTENGNDNGSGSEKDKASDNNNTNDNDNKNNSNTNHDNNKGKDTSNDHSKEKYYDTVLQHLQRALAISRLNEAHRGNAGESARVQWCISRVYEREHRTVVDHRKKRQPTIERTPPAPNFVQPSPCQKETFTENCRNGRPIRVLF
jgi:hypothetical protein